MCIFPYQTVTQNISESGKPEGFPDQRQYYIAFGKCVSRAHLLSKHYIVFYKNCKDFEAGYFLN